MRFSSFNGCALAPPFTVVDSNGDTVYTNSICKALFGEVEDTFEECFTVGGRRYISQRRHVVLCGRGYTVCEIHDSKASESQSVALSERFTSLLGFVGGVSDGGRIRKRPCGTRYLLSLWASLLGEELDEDIDIESLDAMGMGVYSSLNAQGLLIALSCLYRLMPSAKLSVAVSDETVLVRAKGSETADVSAFMYDFLCELARASGFALDFCDGGAAVTLQRFSATAFTAFSPTKEYAEEAMQLALLGLM